MSGNQYPLDPAMMVGDVDDARDAARLALRAIVRRLGGKVAEAATGLDQSHISKALSESPGDRWLREAHVDALLKLATPAERVEYFAARMRAYGYVAAPVAPRTVERRLADLEVAIIRRCGQAGIDVVDEERARP